jgi:hypothetical protein
MERGFSHLEQAKKVNRTWLSGMKVKVQSNKYILDFENGP